MMHGHEKSDLVIVAMKPANKAKKAPCGGVCGGGRSGVGGAKGGGQGEYAPAKHVLDSEPGSRVKGAGAYTATCAVTHPRQEPYAGKPHVRIWAGACDETHVPTATLKREGGSTMKLPRRNFLHLAAGAAALPAVSRFAWAQAYPSRPVRLIIGYAPGASADTTARLIAQWLSERLGQSVVVESRPGGGTNIATEAVVRATPDGYTLLMVGTAQAINATLYNKLNFHFIRDT